LSRARILVVDDDRKTVATVKLYLEHDGFDVSTASDGEQAIEQQKACDPDLIVLDLMLPKIGGLDVCRVLRDQSEVPIIMLTARATEEDTLRGLKLGADDYITKPFSPRELTARVRTVLRRVKTKRESQPLMFGQMTVDLERHEVRLGGCLIRLTPAEFKLLEALASAPDRPLSRQQLVERAFGYNYDGLDRTVDAHIMNLRRKIELGRGLPSMIVTVYGVGYKFSPVMHDP
jgi:DNA-binding response OmpR family regulator